MGNLGQGKYIKFLAVAVIAAFTVSCEAVSSATGPETPNITIAKKLVSKRCYTGQRNTSSGEFSMKAKARIDETRIRYISRGEDNWWKIQSIINGVYGDVYYNTVTGKSICGEYSWNEYGLRYRYIPGDFSDDAFALAVREKNSGIPTKAKIQDQNSQNRPIAVSWEGFGELLAGTMTFNEVLGEGTVSIPLPNGAGTCIGKYQFSDDPPSEASWAVACTNNLAATGTFKGLGKNKGSVGEGTDTNGKKVMFTVGAKP